MISSRVGRIAGAMDSLTEAEAFVGVAFCAAYADGAMGADEDDRIGDHLHGFPALREQDEHALREAMQKVERLARQQGEPALLAAAAGALSPALRETAFYLGADLALADGVVAKEEETFIEALRTHLEVDPSLARRIVDVVLVRNRG